MSWDDDHCPVTELLRTTCVHCRPAAERKRLDTFERAMRHPAAGPGSREIAEDRGFEDGPIVVAAYPGNCPVGDDAIRPGEHIRLHLGRYCHVECL